MKKWLTGLKKSFADIEVAIPDQVRQEIDWSRIDEDRQRLTNMRFKDERKDLIAADGETTRQSERSEILSRWGKDNEDKTESAKAVAPLPHQEDIIEQFPIVEHSNNVEQRKVQSDSSRFWLTTLEKQMLQNPCEEANKSGPPKSESRQTAKIHLPVWKKPTSSDIAQVWLSKMNDRRPERARTLDEQISQELEAPSPHSYVCKDTEPTNVWKELCDDPVYKAIMELNDREAESIRNEPQVVPDVKPSPSSKSSPKKTMRRRSNVISKKGSTKPGQSRSSLHKRMVRLIAEAKQQLGDDNSVALQAQIAYLRSRKTTQPASLPVERLKRQQLS